ncbi:MAG: hypothetical protein QE279_01845 [Rhodoferax sp.]|nr:hypothetical protein [Rhodoferax sp.]
MKIAITLLAAALLGGCASSGTQVSEAAALQFKEGETTEAQIIAKLGKPTSVSIASGMKFISYSGMQYQVKGATFIPIVGAFAGGADYTMSMAMYQIGANGVLEKITYSTSGTGTRSGVAPAAMESVEPSAVK